MNEKISKSKFGVLPDGSQVDLYTLQNAHGLVCKILTYGGIITEFHVPDRDGNLADVVLGCDRLQDYLEGRDYFGGIVGRVGNRIARGQFSLDGVKYSLATNNGINHLHGGNRGFDKVLWQAEPLVLNDRLSLRLTYRSPDAEEGYPGTLDATVAYTLTDGNEFRVDYQATAGKSTPVNMTNHTYWNLGGRNGILDHVLTMAADHYTPVDDTLIPTGEIKAVKGTPMDFTSPVTIGSQLARLPGNPPGFDHNFVLNSGGGTVAFSARLLDPVSGRVLEISTDQPGLQFYSGNFLDGSQKGKRGTLYQRYGGLCLETQHFPDFVNHPNFPQSILRPGKTYRQSMLCRFSTH
jgi:aldose 1-epimerase